MAGLVAGGWVRPDGPGAWTVSEVAGRRLDRLAHGEPATEILARFANHLTRARECRGVDVVATVRAAARHGLAGVAIRLAAVTWRAVPPGADRTWWRSLAEAGEDAAIEGGVPDGLVELLHLSGTTYARAGDIHAADRQWRRAFALTERVGDRERSAELLRAVGDLRRSTGSFGRALTAFHELVGLREEQGDRLGLAEALTEVAVTMLQAGRRADAGHFLQRAGEVSPPAGTLEEPALSRHATTLVTLGRCWDQLDEPVSAMPCYSKALAELIDVDDGAAEEVRELLAAASARRRDEPVATRGRGSAGHRATG
jgi:tetratricopeptide (TPR) repeat protein